MSRLHALFQTALVLSLVFSPVAQAAPIAYPETYYPFEDTPLVTAAPGLLQNDDPNGGTGSLAAVKVTDPAHGTVSIQTDGSFTYTPAANYWGPDSFQYKIVQGAGPIVFTVDQNNSVLTIDVSSAVAVNSVTDSKTTTAKTKGTVTAAIAPTQAPFSNAQIRAVDVSLATQASVTLCVAKLLGSTGPCIGSLTARIDPDGMRISMTEAQAGPAVSVTAGSFTQLGNLIDTTGTMNLSTSGAASVITVPPTADLNSTNQPYDYTGATIAQNGSTLTLSVPIDMSQTLVDPQYTATVRVHGTIRATAAVPPAGVESNVTTVTLDVTAVDDSPVAVADRYYTRQNHTITIPATVPATTTETLVPASSTWKYRTGVDLGTTWRSPEYNDAAWSSAPGPLGYDDDIGPASTIPARANMAADASASNPNYPTAYFRREFTLTSPFDTLVPRVEFQRDDACIIYVNGVEIYRDSTPYTTGGTAPLLAGEVTYGTYAGATITEADSLLYKSVTFSRSVLREGRNVIAAEVHQASSTSRDVRFDLMALRTRGVAGVLSNDTDVDGPAMSVVLHAPPSHGTLQLSANGAFSYTPAPNFPASGASDTDSFVYRHNVDGQPVLTSAIILPMKSANWKYLDNGTAAPQDTGITSADWRNAAFNDAAWNTGGAELGYGDGDEATLVADNATAGYNSPDTDRYITTYFRRKFDYTGSTDLVYALKARVIRDDGVVIWLNGTRIVKDNMPATWTSATPASTSINGAAESTPIEVLNIPPAALKQGENILAVEIHQQSPSSSDISFDMELSAESAVGAKVEIVVLSDDVDNDNVSDTWERLNGLDATVANASADADGDGFSNRAEFLAGTDPRNSNSRLRLGSLSALAGDQLQLTFDSVPGVTYHLQESDFLGSWADTGADFPAHPSAPQTTLQFTKPGAARKFYRLRVATDWQ